MTSERSVLSRTRMRLVAAAASLAIAGAVGFGAASMVPGTVMADPVRLEQPVQAPSFADVVDAVSPAVVSVRVRGEAPPPGEVVAPFFDMPGFENLPENHPLRRFFDQFREPPRQGQQPRQRVRPIAQGSGFFISADGYLVTNNHVIDGGNEYLVALDDGTEFKAELVGTDERTDLAVLKVNADYEFTYVEFADDNTVRVGDWVVAVGNPFGLGGTVTAGIVSARGREIGAGPYDDFIQIDAAVNRGNSGGPAFNLAGQVVGVNTAIFSPSGGNVGIAFAIPASLAKTVVEDLIEDGTVRRGWLGVQIQPLTGPIAESLGLEENSGALIVDSNQGEPAARAGIRPGDVITAVNGRRIDSPRALARAIAERDPGETVEVTLWRNNETVELSVELGEMPGSEQSAAASPESEGTQDPSATTTSFGLTVTPAEDGEGLIVTNVEPGSAADDNGIQPGDVIRAINSRQVSSVEDVTAAIESASDAGRTAVLVQIEREDGNRFVALPIG
ncbi:DegQ family serine endoprotease [Chelativorans sp. Marseille-P2723]|uniref:DegQ family serine endoprotease n=1 Tax=Chelativorans sp. Marseille-P2723 TaxID=2709133 RepID=UPI0015715D5B|nr:DegQ family serine endoprotease [Chelativorans sp. Marseille-P2723]